jgi:hypothetical protein
VTGGGCGICGSDDSIDITITDDDGGVAAYACGLCLGRLVGGDECATCGETASGEYQVILPPVRWSHPRYRVCSACRRRWVFDNTELLLARLDRLDVPRFGGDRR